jgi:hypothetical protein
MNDKAPGGTLTGRYVPRGDVREYYYFASWARDGDSVKWDADIHRDGQSVTEVRGIVDAVEASEEIRNVRLAVEAAIEAGVELLGEK